MGRSARSAATSWNGKMTMMSLAHAEIGSAYQETAPHTFTKMKTSKKQNKKTVQIAKAANRILENIEFYMTQEEIDHVKSLFAEEYAIIKLEIECAMR